MLFWQCGPGGGKCPTPVFPADEIAFIGAIRSWAYPARLQNLQLKTQCPISRNVVVSLLKISQGTCLSPKLGFAVLVIIFYCHSVSFQGVIYMLKQRRLGYMHQMGF